MSPAVCPCGAPLPNDRVVRSERIDGPALCSSCWRSAAFGSSADRDAARLALDRAAASLDAPALRRVADFAASLTLETSC